MMLKYIDVVLTLFSSNHILSGCGPSTKWLHTPECRPHLLLTDISHPPLGNTERTLPQHHRPSLSHLLKTIKASHSLPGSRDYRPSPGFLALYLGRTRSDTANERRDTEPNFQDAFAMLGFTSKSDGRSFPRAFGDGY